MLPIARSGPEPLSPLLSLAWTFSLEFPPYPTSSSPAVPLMFMRFMEFIISSLPLSPSLQKLPCIIHISFYPQCCHPRPCQPTTKPHEDPVQIPHRNSLPASLGCFTLTQFLQRFPIWSPSFSRLPPNSGFFHFCLMPPAIPIYPLGPSSAVHGLRPYCSQGLPSAPPTHAHSSSSGSRTGEPCSMGQVALVLSYLFLAFLFYLFTT